MATKLRLQRHGKKARAFYYIVAADSRSKRDGRFIEKLGTYNPNTNPATIDMDFDRAVYWMSVGAQPTDTMRAILKYKGVLLRRHLDKGVVKGALTQEQADAKFEKWVSEKESKIQGKVEGLVKAEADAKKVSLEREVEINAERAKALAIKNSPLVEEAPVAEEGVETQTEEAPTNVEAAPEAPATEEAPKAEAAPEEPAKDSEEKAPEA